MRRGVGDSVLFLSSGSLNLIWPALLGRALNLVPRGRGLFMHNDALACT